MDHEPFFSVVIPTYNREQFILKTLDTVFAQTYRHFEVIVVDDCSTDGTLATLASLVDSGKVRLIRHEKNSERAAARNTGMEHAQGDFVTFLDSDDFMYSSNLADAAEFIHTHPEIKFFHNRFHLVDARGKVVYEFSVPSLRDRLRAITDGSFIGGIGLFVAREIYQKYRFDTNRVLSASEDWEFSLRVMADYELGRIDKINNAALHHDGRSTSQIDLTDLRRRMDYIVAKVSRDPHLSAVYARHLKRLEIGALFYTTSIANQSRQPREALKCLRQIATIDPRAVASMRFVKALGLTMLRR